MQQPIDLAYTAGLFDGEGAIDIQKINMGKRPRGYNHALRVMVQMCDVEGLEVIVKLFGGKIFPRYTPHRHVVYRWELANMKAVTFLQQIMPYLQVKRERALIATQFKRLSNRGMTDSEFNTREALFLQLQKLNNKV